MIFFDVLDINIKRLEEIDILNVYELYLLNKPDSLRAMGRPGFLKSLGESPLEYYVVYKELTLIAFGGLRVDRNRRSIFLIGDMIHPMYKTKNLLRPLTKYRLAQVHKEHEHFDVIVTATGGTCQYYLDLGFQVISRKPSFWSAGEDLYELKLSRDKLLK